MSEENREVSGVVFPVGEDGSRSTTAYGKAVVADAVRPVDPELAAKVEAERSWRTGYLDHVVAMTAAGARNGEAALTVARSGLESAQSRMRFARDGEELPLVEAMRVPPPGQLGTTLVRGRGERSRGLAVPYRGQLLEGDSLRRQLDEWVAARTVEQSFADAVTLVINHPDWLDLSDRAFALLGAGAELGPLEPLLSWGANVLAVDVPAPHVWERILRTAAVRSGTLHVPVRPGARAGDAASAGADLLTETPELADWLTATATGLPLTIGSYAYLDGAKHVQVAIAGDALISALLGRRSEVSYAELATPTDAFVVPEEIVADARSRWKSRGWRAPLQGVARKVSRNRGYLPAYTLEVPTDDKRVVGIADSLVPQQGPNYALAKRVQRWRAVMAREDDVVVSANVAPATRTKSVTKNKLLAAAYSGAKTFGVEVFEPETSRVLMAALLVHDLRYPAAQAPLAHPDDLFVQSAAHGGLWRVGYQPRSVLPIAAVGGLLSKK